MSATRMARSLAFFDLLKEIVVDDRGVARARWWDANDGLKARRLADASRANESLSSFDRTGWDLSTGLIVEVTLPATGEVGIFVDHNSTAGSGVGVGVSFNFSTSTAFVGNVAISGGGGYTLQRTESSSTINRTQQFGPRQQLERHGQQQGGLLLDMLRAERAVRAQRLEAAILQLLGASHERRGHRSVDRDAAEQIGTRVNVGGVVERVEARRDR